MLINILIALAVPVLFQLILERADQLSGWINYACSAVLPKEIRDELYEQGAADIFFVEGRAWKILTSIGLGIYYCRLAIEYRVDLLRALVLKDQIAAALMLIYVAPLFVLLYLSIRIFYNSSVLQRRAVLFAEGEIIQATKFNLENKKNALADFSSDRYYGRSLMHRSRLDELPFLIDVLLGRLPMNLCLRRWVFS